MVDNSEKLTLEDELRAKIKVLQESIWERRADWPLVSRWISQFEDEDTTHEDRTHALYLLSNFMYFGTNEIRALLKSLYRDVFRSSVIAELRQSNPSISMVEAQDAAELELRKTRFVSLGNPSESSAFLLYYFRQENEIPRDCFISGAEIFSNSVSGPMALHNDDITRYVFIDDMCGSGHQGAEYSRNTVVPLKHLKPDVKVYYYALFGTSDGINHLRTLGRFDIVHPVVELDDSFKCFHPTSRVYKDAPSSIELSAGRSLALRFGSKLAPGEPLGYGDGQLLLGFAYNTPDNSLPIIWSVGTSAFPWTPVFKRHSKIYLG